ncbi:MAG: transketolase [Tissierellia bacterium]|nr:transketolase [Tissierellia bacterium]
MNIDKRSIETIRFLSVDAVNRANSGHPGLPMGVATMAYVLFKEHLKFNPADPNWLDRDRFILSAGHGSMLQYSLLHLFGYDLSMEEIKNFRQLGSKTPGHPEYGITPGVEMTTGPLGQGLAASVGFAMAEARLAAELNTEENNLIDHYTYVIVGDGDLMEGVSYEACSLAGHLRLNKLIVLFDSNEITIDGRTDLARSEDIQQRFRSINWNTILVEDGNDYQAVNQAINQAKSSDKPTLIELKTIIGYGSINKADSSAAHGAPLGVEEARLTKQAFGWDPDKEFHVPPQVADNYATIVKQKQRDYDDWMERFNALDNKQEVLDRLKTEPGEGMLDGLFSVESVSKATRVHGQTMINALYPYAPYLFGGSADLAGSNLSTIDSADFFSAENRTGANVHFGIREFAMACIVNGITLHGGYRAFGSTFLSFADYMKPAIRLAALMEIPSVFIFTHDSIGVGEDGPTHQPIEQALMLRSIPGMHVFRPADSAETAIAYYQAFSGDRPACILLTRQNLPELSLNMTDGLRGGYVAYETGQQPDLIVMASGSELYLAVEAAKALQEEIQIRVVSMLSMELFEQQPEEYKKKVLPDDIRKRFAIEAASRRSWDRYLGLDGDSLTLDRFGESAPGKDLFEHFGFTTEQVTERIRRYMQI